MSDRRSFQVINDIFFGCVEYKLWPKAALRSVDVAQSESLLLGKADIQILTFKELTLNDLSALRSDH